MRPETFQDLLERNCELQIQLDEAQETLRALRNGEVDAVVTAGPDGDRVYTLKGADEAYRVIVQDMAEGAVTLTLDGLILFSNEQFASMLGRPLERVIGSYIRDSVVPEDTPVLTALVIGLNGRSAEVRLNADGGRTVPVYLSVNTLVLDGVECVCVIVTDLTEQKRNQEIVAAEKLARSILDQAAAAILVIDPAGRIIRASRAAERLAGLTVLLRDFDAVFPLRTNSDSNYYAFAQILSTLQRSGEITDLEATFHNPAGRMLDVLVSATLLTGSDGELLGCTVILHDITSLKRAEEALRASEEQLRQRVEEMETILDVAPAAIFVAHDPKCDVVTGNRLANEICEGAPGEDLSPDGPAPRLWFRDGREVKPEGLPMQEAAALGRDVRNSEVEVLLPSGRKTVLIGQASPLRDAAGRVRGCVGAFLDITERKRTEEQFRQTQKLESIGLLAGGIAHDFNNLLTGIMGNASLAMEEAGQDVSDRLQAIVSSGERAAHLTRQLLAYSGKGQFIIEDLDLSCAVREMVDLFRLSIPKSIELRLDLHERLPLVAMDPGQLQQVVMNLVINAGEAIGEGNSGRISVSTEACDVERGFVDALGEDIAPGLYVCLEVADTGPGIDERMKPKIFDPFFTTKFTGRGLGLAAVSGIVRSQKGAIVLRSVDGHGTAFRVFFRAAQTGRRQSGQQPAEEVRGTILVVDDEESIRKFISAVLQKHGFRVLEANDGREALAVCEKERQGLKIVILDLIMPVMGGSEFLVHVKRERPDLKVLLTSGYGEAEARRLCAAYGGAAFIQKPYTAQQLAVTVEKLFGSEPRS